MTAVPGTTRASLAEFPDTFLQDREPRTWSGADGVPASVKPKTVFVQDADNGLEVAVAVANRRPTSADMRKAWKARHRGRACPVLLVVAYEHGDQLAAAVCGPSGEEPPVHTDLELSRVERLAATALTEPNRHAAQRCLLRLLPEVDAELPGLVNSGLLATHELRDGVPRRADWGSAVERGRGALTLRGRRLIERLGFSIEALSTNTSLLKAGDERRAVAVLLDEGESFEGPAQRFDGVSPVSHALAVADREQLSWVMLTRSSEIRLYTARPDVGVGRKGRAETFVEANLALLPEGAAGYLQLLFSADGLARGGSVEQILSSSGDFAADLAARLRERVYKEAVPALARAIAARLDKPIDEAALSSAHEQTLTILFRLLFVAYGEDKDLLPYDTNGSYADHSLKRIARRFADDINASKLVFDEAATDLWEDVTQLWRAIERGNKRWGVPPYDGGLFAADEEHPVGAALGRLALTDAEVGPALAALLVDTTPERVVGPVDFRSLSVREFGTIYEGLLESELSVAPTDLSIDPKGNYIPAQRGAKVVVAAGTVYLHNRSGARKATGSYFTKPFAVEHLLDHALEPALADHLHRVQKLIDAGDDTGAAEAFFDFRCADIAMGSGHFLVAAVDRIEARLSAFLALHPLSIIVAELEKLRAAALSALGDLADGVEIETTSLLRRQVARRCIYGVDRNRIAVELARLATWIHTFVPGLPLSFLDHNLVCGNSLTGIGTIDEAVGVLDPKAARSGEVSLYRDHIDGFLDRASNALRRLARVTDATIADVHTAQRAHAEALKAVHPAQNLFDLLVAGRLGETQTPITADEAEINANKGLPKAHSLARELETLHFPVAFPEVFERTRPGFDCIVGNPPWEKLQLEEHSFYTLSYPGLRGLPQVDADILIERIRHERPDLVRQYAVETARTQAAKKALASGPYPGMNAGRPDLYKAFAWRFLQLARADGLIGVVLPRKAVEASGMTNWRLALLQSCELEDVTMLVNRAGWVFDDAEQRYTIGLLSIRCESSGARVVRLRGPFTSMMDYRRGMSNAPVEFSTEDLLSWSESATLPLLRSHEGLGVFGKMRAHPALAKERQRWAPRGMRELNASDDREHFLFDVDGRGLWPVYKGESFDLWTPETGTVYAYADPAHIIDVLKKRRRNQIRMRRSAFYSRSAAWANDPETLPACHPRIAWRDSSRASDSRTVRAALIPPNVVLVHQAYTLFWRSGGPREEAYALGVLSSMPFDWFARQLVESHVTVEFMNSAPVPERGPDDSLRRRVEEMAGRLAAVDERFEPWADGVGVSVGSVGEAEKQDLLAKLDATVALLYGLDKDDLHVIYTTFHEAADYSAHEKRVLEHYRRLR